MKRDPCLCWTCCYLGGGGRSETSVSLTKPAGEKAGNHKSVPITPGRRSIVRDEGVEDHPLCNHDQRQRDENLRTISGSMRAFEWVCGQRSTTSTTFSSSEFCCLTRIAPVQQNGQTGQTPQMRRHRCLAMAKHGVNNFQVHKARVLHHFTPKLKWGGICLAVSGSHLKWPNTRVKNQVSLHFVPPVCRNPIPPVTSEEHCFSLLGPWMDQLEPLPAARKKELPALPWVKCSCFQFPLCGVIIVDFRSPCSAVSSHICDVMLVCSLCCILWKLQTKWGFFSTCNYLAWMFRNLLHLVRQAQKLIWVYWEAVRLNFFSASFDWPLWALTCWNKYTTREHKSLETGNVCIWRRNKGNA